MDAVVGDRFRTPGRHVGDAVRSGLVIEVRGHGKAPLYLVRWEMATRESAAQGRKPRWSSRSPADGAAVHSGCRPALHDRTLAFWER